jgi:hypothetical protein
MTVDLHDNEFGMQIALDHQRRFDMLLYMLFWSDYDTAISRAGLGKYLTGVLAIGICIAAGMTVKQDCSGINELSRFNASGEPACEAVRFTKMDPSTKTEIPMHPQEARAACESAGPDGGGLCEYTRSPEGVWEDTQKQVYMVLVALISIPLMALLSFVDLWLRDVLFPVFSRAVPARRSSVGTENPCHDSDGTAHHGDSLTKQSSSFVAHHSRETSFDTTSPAVEQSTHNGKLPSEWLVLNVPDMTTPTPCFQQPEKHSFATHAFQVLFNNSGKGYRQVSFKIIKRPPNLCAQS